MPDDFAEIGAVDGARALRRASCLEDESVIRNYLRPNESAFYISAAEDLTAREMIKRVEPVEFFIGCCISIQKVIAGRNWVLK